MGGGRDVSGAGVGGEGTWWECLPFPALVVDPVVVGGELAGFVVGAVSVAARESLLRVEVVPGMALGQVDAALATFVELAFRNLEGVDGPDVSVFTMDNADGRAEVIASGVWQVTVCRQDGSLLLVAVDVTGVELAAAAVQRLSGAFAALAAASGVSALVAKLTSTGVSTVAGCGPLFAQVGSGVDMSEVFPELASAVVGAPRSWASWTLAGSSRLPELTVYPFAADGVLVVDGCGPVGGVGSGAVSTGVVAGDAGSRGSAAVADLLLVRPVLSSGDVVDGEVVWSSDGGGGLLSCGWPERVGELVDAPAVGGLVLLGVGSSRVHSPLPAKDAVGVFEAALEAVADGVVVFSPVVGPSGDLVSLTRRYVSPSAAAMRRSTVSKGGRVAAGGGSSGDSDVFAALLLGPAQLAWDGQVFEVEAPNTFDADLVPSFFRVRVQRVGDWIVVVMTDLSQRSRQRAALADVNDRYLSTLSVLSEGVVRFVPVVDVAGEVVDLELVFANPACAGFVAGGDLPGLPASPWRLSQGLPRLHGWVLAGVRRALAGEQVRERVDNRGRCWPELAARVVDVEVAVSRSEVVCVLTDRTESVNVLERLRLSALTAQETGALNAAGLFEHVSRRWLQPSVSVAVLWVWFTSLAQARYVFGHEVASRALSAAFARAQEFVADRCRSGPVTLAQPDQETLVVVFDEVSSVAQVSAECELLVAALTEAVEVALSPAGSLQGVALGGVADDDGAGGVGPTPVSPVGRSGWVEVALSPAAGLCFAPLQAELPGDVLRRASSSALSAGFEQVPLFRWGPSVSTGHAERLQLLGELAHAPEQGLWQVRFQPQFELASMQVTSAWAQVSWRHPSGGGVPAGQLFEQVAASVPLLPLTTSLLRSVLREFAPALQPGCPVSVPVHGRVLADRRFAFEVADALVEAGCSPQALQLLVAHVELTDVARSRGTLEELSALGVSVALDRVMAVPAVLPWGRSVPVSQVWLDRSVSRLASDDPVAASAVRALASLTGLLPARLCVTGVESQGHVDRLQALGVDCAAGHFLAAPVSGASWVRLFAST